MSQNAEEEISVEFCSLDTSLIGPFINPPKEVLDLLMTTFGIGESMFFIKVQAITMLCSTHLEMCNNSNMMQDGVLTRFNNFLMKWDLDMCAVTLQT